MLFPLWSLYGLGAALFATAMPLLQEKFRVNGLVLAAWVKFFLLVLIAPFAFAHGLPGDPWFYIWTALTAALYCVSDVIYYNAVSSVGAGLISRLLPLAVILTFPLWLVAQPEQWQVYVDHPLRIVAIIGILCLFSFFVLQIKNCPLSLAGIKKIWFVIFAACVGPVFVKLALQHAPEYKASFAFMFVQGAMMLGFWLAFLAVKKPLPRNELFNKYVIRAGFIIGAVATCSVYLKMQAFLLTENPAFASILFFTDALWIPLVYKFIGRKDASNLWAGLGIVACAALLVLVKNIQ